MHEAYKKYCAHAERCEECFRAKYYGNPRQCPEGRRLEREALQPQTPTERMEKCVGRKIGENGQTVCD
jgi:hypothetical protein